jgi:hypothetical protein
VEQAELRRMERMIDSEVKTRFTAGAVRRVALRQTQDDPEELLVRVFIGITDGSQDPRRSLEKWAQAHEKGMKRLRRELSLRLPEARLRYTGRPVYVLTSHETFSGGEDFGYTLQAQGRAQVIGETTGGGAHPTRMIPISETLAVSVPFARSVNPVTGTNWQGTGVVPDTEVPADQAYDVAYARALRHVLSLTVPPPVADEARAALAGLGKPD